MLTLSQTARQNCQGYHGVREQDRPTMGRLHWRVQELSAEKDGLHRTGVNSSPLDQICFLVDWHARNAQRMACRFVGTLFLLMKLMNAAWILCCLFRPRKHSRQEIIIAALQAFFCFRDRTVDFADGMAQPVRWICFPPSFLPILFGRVQWNTTITLAGGGCSCQLPLGADGREEIELKEKSCQQNQIKECHD